MNHEVVEDIKLETILEDIQKIVDFINIPGSEGSKENIDKYNADINTPDAEVVGNDHMFIVESDDESDEEDDEIKERVDNVEKRVEKVNVRIKTVR
jgi:tetrahydromethanopterin S-methyltransferase subunit G